MFGCRVGAFGVLTLAVMGLSAMADTPTKKEPRTRSFLFHYTATIDGLTAGKNVRVWLPVPPSTEDQDVDIVLKNLPAKAQVDREPLYGNQIMYIHAPAPAQGPLTLSVSYKVTRREVRADFSKKPDSAEKISRFLQPDAMVPVGGKPLKLLKGREVPMDAVEAARLFYDVVNNHMRYSKEGLGWGRGDAEWACDSRYGNCSDFHSLFISLVRSQKIPAKFEIGFPLPEQRGAGEIPGYHCWAKFRPADKDWIPVDISEANKNPQLREYYFGNLTEDRITFSTGRDIDLVPKQDGPPLNFFVYPYVEVDGKALPPEKIGRQFAFQDLPVKREK
jgi:transglutaminase-like putative cysteine protease